MMRHMQDLMTQMVQTTHHMVGAPTKLTEAVAEGRDHLADFLRFSSGRDQPDPNYFWGPHCFDAFPFAGRSRVDFSMRSDSSALVTDEWANSW